MKTRLNLAATGLNLTNFPAQPWITNVELITGLAPVQYESVNIYTTQLEVTMYNGRKRRVFVSTPTAKPPRIDAYGTVIQGSRSAFVVGLCGSDANGDGAMDLITPPVGDYQYRWPLAVAKDHNMIAVLVDAPLFGQYEYPEELNNPYDTLIGDICGVEAARWYLDNSLALSVYGIQPVTKNCFVGGISWGGMRTQFLAAALQDCVAAYVASAQVDKAYDTRPFCSPPDWAAANYNYADMLKVSTAKKIRIAFGGNGGDYLYTPFRPGIDTIVDGLVSYDNVKFSKHINATLAHQIDLADIRAFFTSCLSPTLFYTVPKYADEHP